MTSNSTTGVQSSDSPTNIPLAAASDNGGANRTNHCSDTPDQIFSKNAAVIEVVEHINLIRAAMYSLPGFPKEVRRSYIGIIFEFLFFRFEKQRDSR